MLPLRHKQNDLYAKALLLNKEIYRITAAFPDSERAVLAFSLRRLSVSLCQNIAAGLLKKNKKRKQLFKACLDDCIFLDTQLEIAVAVSLLSVEDSKIVATCLNEIYKKLTATNN
ncbi:MAG TPA: four helix bundle protein [Chitinophagaceae bacterium]|nr:four helix bundle protein [Chitinophagaceae bacterium]